MKIKFLNKMNNKKNEVLTAASETCGKLSQTLVATGVVISMIGWVLSGFIKPKNNKTL